MPDGGYIYVALETPEVDLREPRVSKAAKETNKIFKGIQKAVLQNKLIERTVLRKMSKRMFNKRRPEWLTAYEMARLITAWFERQEQKNAKGEQCKVTSKSSQL